MKSLVKILSGIIVVALFLFSISSTQVEAQSTSDQETINNLTTQLSSLLSVIASLQEQLTALQGGTQATVTPVPTLVDTTVSVGTPIVSTQTTTLQGCVDIPKNLYQGHTDTTSIKRLQEFLQTRPEAAWPQDIDAGGYYGSITANAVKRFQAFHGIVSSGTPLSTGYGAVGPSTVRKIKEVSCQTVVTSGAVSNVQAPQVSSTTTATATITGIGDGLNDLLLVSGTSDNTSVVGFAIAAQSGDKVYGSGNITVQPGGSWSHQLNYALAAGPHTIILYIGNQEVFRHTFEAPERGQVFQAVPSVATSTATTTLIHHTRSREAVANILFVGEEASVEGVFASDIVIYKDASVIVLVKDGQRYPVGFSGRGIDILGLNTLDFIVPSIPAGTYGLYITKTTGGNTNQITVEVVTNTGADLTAAITGVSQTATPKVIGVAATGVGSVGFAIAAQSGDKVYGSGNIPVVNNKWTHTVRTSLRDGSYELVLYVNNQEVDRNLFTLRNGIQTNSLQITYPNGQTFKTGDAVRATWTGRATDTAGRDLRYYSVYLQPKQPGLNRVYLGNVDIQQQSFFSFRIPTDLKSALISENRHAVSFVNSQTNTISSASFRISTPSAADPEIIVSSQQTRERWERGNTYPIVWDPVNFFGTTTVRLAEEVRQSNGSYVEVERFAANLNPGVTRYNLTVPQSLPTASYIVRVCGNTCEEVKGQAANKVEIVDAVVSGTIDILAPGAGNYAQESSLGIAWRSSGLSKVGIELRNFSTGQVYNVASTTLSQDSVMNIHRWTVPASVPVGFYGLSIYGGNASSSVNFNITGPNRYTNVVISRSILSTGDSIHLSWDAPSYVAQFPGGPYISVVTPMGETVANLPRPGTGVNSITWAVPGSFDSDADREYAFKIDLSNFRPVPVAYSTFFGVTKSATSTPRVILISPNGGGTYSPGDSVPIRFKANLSGEEADTMIVRLYKDVGGVLTLTHHIAPDSPITEFDWTIPASVTPGNYKIKFILGKVIAFGNQVWYEDFSDEFFTVTSGNVSIADNLSQTASAIDTLNELLKRLLR
jgi:hypothetical protein